MSSMSFIDNLPADKHLLDCKDMALWYRSSGYAGEKFELTGEDRVHALLRIYTKNMKEGNGNKIRIRIRRASRVSRCEVRCGYT